MTNPHAAGGTGGTQDPVGIVLCGGASMRMGRDKASMGDPPWAHRVATALAGSGCGTVELQGGVEGLGTASWLQVPDLEPGGGPAPALAQAASRHCGHPLVVAACDLPELRSSAVTQLIETITHVRRGAAAYRVEGRANWSLVALDATLVAQLAAVAPADLVGAPLKSMLGRLITLLEPTDARAVTDMDEPPV